MRQLGSQLADRLLRLRQLPLMGADGWLVVVAFDDEAMEAIDCDRLDGLAPCDCEQCAGGIDAFARGVERCDVGSDSGGAFFRLW